MKLFVNVLFFFAAAFVFVECLPRFGEEGQEPMSSEELESSDESPEGFGFFPFGFNLYAMQDFFRTLTEKLRGVTSAGPGPEWGKVANATSTKQVIDGHVVTINDTTYRKEGNDTDAVFFVRVIDVKPAEDIGDVTPADVENEAEVLNKNKNDTSNEISQGQTQDSHHADLLLETRDFEPSYDDIDNSIDIFETEPVRLDDDILVNKMRHDETKGGIFMVPHDVEVFDVEDGKPVYSYNPYYHPNDFSQRTQKIVT